jgi:tRNA (mo5U34)-methyltransferase
VGARTVRVGGFRLTLEVPHRVSHAVRRAQARVAPGRLPAQEATGRLLVRPAPEVPFERRDLDDGFSFIRRRLDHRAQLLPAPAEGEDAAAELARLVAGRPWYHTIELPHGIVTPGEYDHRALVPHYGIPGDLTGKRVLDVASADGFWTFELERRGADVTALDIETTADVDLPGPVRQRVAEQGLVDTIPDGFRLAHKALGSRATHRTGTIYDLDPDQLGRFDLVHAGDVLLHLRDPLLALEQIRRVTGGQALLSDVFEPSLPVEADEGLHALYLGGGNAAWWRPSLQALVQMVADAGFATVEVVTTYNLAARDARNGPWRAVLLATP